MYAIMYSGTLIIGPLLGRAKIGHISKVVTLSRWSWDILSPSRVNLYGYQDVRNLKQGSQKAVQLIR